MVDGRLFSATNYCLSAQEYEPRGRTRIRRSHEIKKEITSAVLITTLATGGAVSAQALTAGSDFASVVPRLQQSHYREYQNKETPNPSVVYFDSIGGGYLMNVKAETDCVLRRGVDVCLCPAATVVRRSA